MADAAPSRTVRTYYRIPSIVPVDFQLLSKSGDPIDQDVRTGFTRDLSEGGLCLQLHSLPDWLAKVLDDRRGEPRISIDISLPKRTLRVAGRVAWCHIDSESGGKKRLVGVEFLDLDSQTRAAVADYGRRAARRPMIIRGVGLGLLLLLVAVLGLYGWSEREHETERKELQSALTQTSGQKEAASKELENLYVELRWLSVEVAEIATTIGQERQPDDLDFNGMGSAIEDLTANVAEVRSLVQDLKGVDPDPEEVAETQQAAPPEPGRLPAATETPEPQ